MEDIKREEASRKEKSVRSDIVVFGLTKITKWTSSEKTIEKDARKKRALPVTLLYHIMLNCKTAHCPCDMRGSSLQLVTFDGGDRTACSEMQVRVQVGYV